MRRVVLGLTMIGLAGVIVGAAASLTFGTASLGAAKVTIPRCTSTGLTVIQTLSGVNVVSVTVGNLPTTCGGATIQATLNNGLTNSSGSATVPSGGGSVTVTLALAVAATTTEETDLVVNGP